MKTTLKDYREEWIKFITPTLTDLEAVRQDGFALEHVINQTEDICLAAIKQNACALRYVDKKFME